MALILRVLNGFIDRVKSVVRYLRHYLPERKFYRIGLTQVKTFNIPANAAEIPLHIITVTFNNELLLAQQQRLIQKHVSDKHLLIVADNSPDESKRRKIAELCERAGTAYISLPENPHSIGSNSHAACLNWMFRNYIHQIKPRYFGFIDHDIYPIKSHSIINYLIKQPIYGAWQGGSMYWYLWAGLCFFNSDSVKKFKFDFTPTHIAGNFADTGGSNWKHIYRHLEREKIYFPPQSYLSLREGNIPQSDKMELIGEWLHSFNGSYWMNVPPKENVLLDYLNKL
jgi:hypothetical protein